VINQNISQRNGETKSAISVIVHQIIARGMVHVTAIFAKGARRDTCQN
jgi:hypothetical protein